MLQAYSSLGGQVLPPSHKTTHSNTHPSTSAAANGDVDVDACHVAVSLSRAASQGFCLLHALRTFSRWQYFSRKDHQPALSHPTVKQIGDAHHKSAAQVTRNGQHASLHYNAYEWLSTCCRNRTSDTLTVTLAAHFGLGECCGCASSSTSPHRLARA